jgi:hypothetical protein
MFKFVRAIPFCRFCLFGDMFKIWKNLLQWNPLFSQSTVIGLTF